MTANPSTGSESRDDGHAGADCGASNREYIAAAEAASNLPAYQPATPGRSIVR
jgi:hypothetical protein